MTPPANRATPARRPMMAGNWKMNCTHLEAIALVQKVAFSLKDTDLARVEVVVLPPFTAIRSVQTLVDGDHLAIGYGAQDMSDQPDGAHTGDVSARMLTALGCSYVVVGHSERRRDHDEHSSMVNRKVRAAVAAGIVPILCVGEHLDVRQAGGHVDHTLAQLEGGLAGVKVEQAASLVVAYEPIWAIGTGEVATPDDAQEVCAAIRDRLGDHYSPSVAGAVRILYGGSVKASSAPGLMAMPDIDGGLVGGASVDAAEFAGICRYSAT